MGPQIQSGAFSLCHVTAAIRRRPRGGLVLSDGTSHGEVLFGGIIHRSVLSLYNIICIRMYIILLVQSEADAEPRPPAAAAERSCERRVCTSEPG